MMMMKCLSYILMLMNCDVKKSQKIDVWQCLIYISCGVVMLYRISVQKVYQYGLKMWLYIMQCLNMLFEYQVMKILVMQLYLMISFVINMILFMFFRWCLVMYVCRLKIVCSGIIRVRIIVKLVQIVLVMKQGGKIVVCQLGSCVIVKLKEMIE